MRKVQVLSHADLVDIPGRTDVKWLAGNDIVKRIKSAVAADTLTVSLTPNAASDSTPGDASAMILTVSDCPPDFVAEYFDAGHAGRDPTLSLMHERGDVADDHDGLNGAATSDSSGLANLLERFRIRNRTFVPVVVLERRIAHLWLSRADRLTPSEIGFLTWAARPLVEALTQAFIGAGLARGHGLTLGEVICLRLASQGHSSEKIAQETGFSFQTVNSYLKDAARKLGAANRTQAVVSALKFGIID